MVARPYRLEYHGTWRIDVEHLAASIADDTRAVLVVSPNNPTGSFLHRDDLVAIEELCAARDLAIIGDEVFADFPLEAARPRRRCSSARRVMTCSLGGLSKSAGLPQMKVGWIAFGGPAARVAESMRAFEVVADTYLSVSTPAQVAAAQLPVDGCRGSHADSERVARNLQALRAVAAAHPAASVLRTEGGWSAVVQVPAYQSEEALTLELLTEDRVLVHPGYFFDFEREAYPRRQPARRTWRVRRAASRALFARACRERAAS